MRISQYRARTCRLVVDNRDIVDITIPPGKMWIFLFFFRIAEDCENLKEENDAWKCESNAFHSTIRTQKVQLSDWMLNRKTMTIEHHFVNKRADSLSATRYACKMNRTKLGRCFFLLFILFSKFNIREKKRHYFIHLWIDWLILCVTFFFFC